MKEAFDSFWARWRDFTGLSSRQNFWLSFLWIFIVNVCLGAAIGLTTDNNEHLIDGGSASVSTQASNWFVLWVVVFFAFNLTVLIPYIALTWRRLHDVGTSGAWFFIQFIPFVGGIVLLVLLALPPDVKRHV